MKIIYMEGKISRYLLQLHPEWVFLFGDNIEKIGLGGQAKEMRGEPNAIGIPTKKSPWIPMSDLDINLNKEAIRKAFNLIPKGSTVVIPVFYLKDTGI